MQSQYEMKCELIKIKELSGNKASIYSVIIDKDDTTLFEKFINENFDSHLSEIKNIIQRLKIIGTKTGAREHFLNYMKALRAMECALYDDPDKNLRLYCIRYGIDCCIGWWRSQDKRYESISRKRKTIR